LTRGSVISVDVSNVLNEEKKQQVIALGRLTEFRIAWASCRIRGLNRRPVITCARTTAPFVRKVQRGEASARTERTMCVQRLKMLAAMWLIAAPGLAQTVSFNSPQTFLLNGAGPVFVADFNGDGKPDLLTQGYYQVAILFGNGAGTFQPASYITPNEGPGYLRGVVVGDFNGDGKLDVAVAVSDHKLMLVILLGNGDGTFETLPGFKIENNPSFLTAADMNGDGKADLVMGGVGGVNTVGVWLSNGDGTFQSPKFYAADKQPRPAAVADFNGDGKPDLAVVNGESDKVSILLGNGDGTL